MKNIIGNKIYCRIHQQVYRIASYFIKWRNPKVLKGDKGYDELINTFKNNEKILIVTDKALFNLGLLNTLIQKLNSKSIEYIIYDKVKPNPTVKNVEEALDVFKDNNCSLVIGFGGGSAIDCAKIVIARVSRPKKTIEQMKGILKIRRRNIPFVAIPTTSGSGSEVTIAAVVTDEKTHEKYAISDNCLVPDYVVMDSKLTYNLPQFITATTGMDALTHAIEAFIGKSNTKQTKKDALFAIKLISENIYKAYVESKNEKARENMQIASFYAGKAFTRAYVGNVHAIAHSLGGKYNLGHGYANAVTLPIVLKIYSKDVEAKLAIISDYIGLSESNSSNYSKSQKLIQWIEDVNKLMNIPSHIEEIKEEDIEDLAKKAFYEANPMYPVPQIWSYEDFKKVFLILKGAQ